MSFHRMLAVLSLIAIWMLPSTVFAEGDLLIGGTTYFESGLMDGEERVSVQESDESFEFTNGNYFSARLGYMRPIAGSIHIGGALDFIGTYRAELVEEDPDPDDPPEYYEFGTLLEAMILAEWRLALGESFGLGLGAHGGAAVLFPRGDFDADIRELQDQDVGVWRVPRPGYGGGAHAAFTWRFDERMSLRAETGVKWQWIMLFRTNTTVDDVSYRKRWTSSARRAHLGVMLQIDL